MKNKLFYWVFLLSVFFSCVEPYEKSFLTSGKIIIIEGILSNQPGLKPVQIKESIPSPSGSTTILPLKGAKVFILSDKVEKTQLLEKEEGFYYFDPNFKGEIGKSYSILINASDGNIFETGAEILPNPVPVESVSNSLDLEAFKDLKGNISPGFKLFANILDPAGIKNNYLWQWKLFEKQNICKSCTGGYYYRTPLPLGSCVEDAILKRYNNIFDYNCEIDCWDIFNSSDLLILSDKLSDGNLLKSVFVGKIPVFQYTDALLEISQFSISEKAYDFINLSQQQGESTGGLADTPPAKLSGNLKCKTDPTINTSGYFIVAGQSTFKYWLDKSEAFNEKVQTTGLLGGRSIKLEPTGPNTTRPPLAPCTNSLNRTNIKPDGWKN